MRISVRFLRRWRMISWPAACGMRWVKPSTASVSPSRMVAAIASARDEIRAMQVFPGAFASYLRLRPGRVKWHIGSSWVSNDAGKSADLHGYRRARRDADARPHALWRAALRRHHRRNGVRCEAQREDSGRWRRLAD